MEGLKRYDDGIVTQVCVTNIHIATPFKDRHGFSLAQTVTRQGKELLK